ncbi:MAG: methyltransferase domain-containing protein, partial [Oscillospiraceae bacterium]
MGTIEREMAEISCQDSEELKVFIRHLASQIKEKYHPQTVLDAGCAMGMLVAALRDLGVEAYGVDLSEYASSRQVREDIRPYCAVGSLSSALPDSLPKRYDLVVSMEVLEHMPEEDAKKAVANLCAVTDRVLFSSVPDDTEDPTHINLRRASLLVRLVCRTRTLFFCRRRKTGFFDKLCAVFSTKEHVGLGGTLREKAAKRRGAI